MCGEEHLEWIKIRYPEVQDMLLKARLYRLFRRIALLTPTDKEVRRMRNEDRVANTIWVPGTDIGIVVGFMEFGARIDPNDPYIGKYQEINREEEDANSELRDLRRASDLEVMYGSSNPEAQTIRQRIAAKSNRERVDAQKNSKARAMRIPE